MNVDEHVVGAEAILKRSALPVAPMAMPEQKLVGERHDLFLRPLLQWLVLRRHAS